MNNDVFLTILIIGIFTYAFRVVLFFKLPGFTENKYIKKGMESIPATMLIALVIPFSIIIDDKVVFLSIEFISIGTAAIIVWKLKKPNYGLIFTLAIYFLLSLLHLPF